MEGYIVTAYSKFKKHRISLTKNPISKAEAKKRCQVINAFKKDLNVDRCKIERL